jgi:hypothetical protein
MNMTLQQIEQALLERLHFLQKAQAEALEHPAYEYTSWGALLDCYNALARVKQAQASERIASVLENMLENGVQTMGR